MEKTSFVFHFDYLADIPQELIAEWTLNIINYAQTGAVPQFEDWRDIKSWNAIQKRMDAEAEKYEKKSNNLRQNKTKNLQSIENRFSETESKISNHRTKISNDENFTSETESKTEKSLGDREVNTDNSSVGVIDIDYVNVFESVIDCVNDADNQPITTKTLNIKYPYPLDAQTVEKINKSLIDINIELSQDALDYAYDVISSKSYGKDKKPFLSKSEAEQKSIYVHALLKYPSDIFTDFTDWQKKRLKDAEKKRLKEMEAQARASPPNVCKCGADLIAKGAGMMCFNCRRTYEIIRGRWTVNE